MATSSQLPNGMQVFLDNNGNPLAAGLVYFYVPATNTPKDTWQDASQSTLNTNPVQLDSAGRAVIFGAGAYRQVLKDSLGNTIWDKLTYANTGVVIVSNIVTKSADYVVTTSDGTVLVNAASAEIDITLPAPATCNGYQFTIKKIDASANLVNVIGSIDGLSTYALAFEDESITVQSNGTSFYIL